MVKSKCKFPRAVALDVARELCRALQPHTRRLIVAGSLRRRKREVGDVEILYVPKTGTVETPSGDFFSGPKQHPLNYADAMINTLVIMKKLRQRENVRGSTTWGDKNKLALHVASGVPVDLFATAEEAWWNYLVCRTGPAESNTRIAMAAQAKGWKWNPYGAGFSRESGLGQETFAVCSEQDVFEFVGLPYAEPWERE